MTGRYASTANNKKRFLLARDEPAPEVITTNDTAYMEFTTDDSGVAGGFVATYSGN